MYRIFKKQHDLAVRNTESRPRRSRQQRLNLEALEGRQLLSLGSEFRVNVNTFATNFTSDNASSANGMHMAVWADDDGFVGGNVIRGQLYNASGFRVGSDNLLITFGEGPGGSVTRPHVAMDAHGNSVVTYQQTINGQTDIIAKRITLNPTTGLPVLGNAIVVAGDQSRNEHDADVAMDANGNFVVTYTLDLSPTDKDIEAVRYNSSGGRIGFVNDSLLNTGDHDETRSSVAMSPDGRFDIVYQSKSHSTGDTFINGARYNSSGVKLVTQTSSDGKILIGGGFDIEALNPSIAMDNAGNAVVAYQEIHNDGGATFPHEFDISAIRIFSDGNVGSFKRITSSGSSSDPKVNNVLPSVALAPTGGSYVVAWDADFRKQGGAQTVEVAEVTGSNVLNFASILPASPTNVAPALSIAGNGNYLLTFDAFDSADHREIDGRFGHLPVAPAAQNLALTSPIQVGHRATLSGQLVDGDGDANLTLTVDWGDGSKPEQSQPGLEPFAVKHKYRRAGTYTVHATWTDSTGLSNSQDLTLVVTRHRVKSGSQAARPHRA
jgi:hypothetical protein